MVLPVTGGGGEGGWGGGGVGKGERKENEKGETKLTTSCLGRTPQWQTLNKDLYLSYRIGIVIILVPPSSLL